jgi:hypothetical protein
MEDEASAVAWPTEDLTVGNVQRFLESYEGPFNNLVIADMSERDNREMFEPVERIRLYWGAGIMDKYENNDPQGNLYRNDYTDEDWARLVELMGQDRYQVGYAAQRYYDTSQGDTFNRVLFDVERHRAELVHVHLTADEFATFGVSWTSDCYDITDGLISYSDGACYWGPRSAEEMIDEVASIANGHHADIKEDDYCHFEEMDTLPGTENVTDGNGRKWVVCDERARRILRDVANRVGIDETTVSKVIRRDDGWVLGYRAVGIYAAAEYLMINDGREILPAIHAEQIGSSIDDGYFCFQIVDAVGDVVMQTEDWQALVSKMEEIKGFADRNPESITCAMTTEELNKQFNLRPLELCPGPGRLAMMPDSGDKGTAAHWLQGVESDRARGSHKPRRAVTPFTRRSPFGRKLERTGDNREEGR